MDGSDIQGYEVDVRVRTTLVRAATVWCREGHVEREWEYDLAEKRQVAAAHWVEEDDVKERYLDDQRRAIQIIEDCHAICRELTRQGQRRVAHVNVADLLLDCEGWDEEEFDVSR